MSAPMLDMVARELTDSPALFHQGIPGPRPDRGPRAACATMASSPWRMRWISGADWSLAVTLEADGSGMRSIRCSTPHRWQGRRARHRARSADAVRHDRCTADDPRPGRARRDALGRIRRNRWAVSGADRQPGQALRSRRQRLPPLGEGEAHLGAAELRSRVERRAGHAPRRPARDQPAREGDVVLASRARRRCRSSRSRRRRARGSRKPAVSQRRQSRSRRLGSRRRARA